MYFSKHTLRISALHGWLSICKGVKYVFLYGKDIKQGSNMVENIIVTQVAIKFLFDTIFVKI